MASDSATTFYDPDGKPGQIYEHANKIVNLVKGLPIGVMTCGSGGIGNASIATLLKDLRQRLAGDDETDAHWKLDPKDYTMEFVSLPGVARRWRPDPKPLVGEDLSSRITDRTLTRFQPTKALRSCPSRTSAQTKMTPILRMAYRTRSSIT
jgi:hypothetical protein